MRRRRFLVEKCKDAESIGIVLCTLTARGYLNAVNHIQSLARNRGIRTYLLSVGKINPAKLANFMEIDCFVLVGCLESSIFDARDYYKPLLSIFEVELALNPNWIGKYTNFYSVDFNQILPNGEYYKAVESKESVNENYDVSLISGRMRCTKVENNKSNSESTSQLETKYNQLMNTISSSTFNNRLWTGLDPNLGKQEPVQVIKGRCGTAIKYTENEQ